MPVLKDVRMTASDTKITLVHCPAPVIAAAAAMRLSAELSNLSY